MLFTRILSVVVALLPVVQVYAAPSTLPLQMKKELSVRQSVEEIASQKIASLDDLVAGIRDQVTSIKSQLAGGDNAKTTMSPETAAAELKTAFEDFVGGMQSLHKAKTDGVNAKLSLNGIFDPKSWPVVGDIYEVVKDVLTLVDQIKTAASAQTAGEKFQAIIDILNTIIQAAPSVISIIMSLLPFLS